MTTKADFNAEEWSKVVQGPLFAGLRVIAAGRGGTIRESMAMGKVYTHARQQQGESPLLDEIVSSPPAIEPQRSQSPDDVARVSREGLQEALATLEAKASPDEVEAYKSFTVSVAQAAAEAHKEGGFLGVGGEKVSEPEKAALAEIASTLGTSVSE